MEWNGRKLPVGIWKNRLPFHTMPWPAISTLWLLKRIYDICVLRNKQNRANTSFGYINYEKRSIDSLESLKNIGDVREHRTFNLRS